MLQVCTQNLDDMSRVLECDRQTENSNYGSFFALFFTFSSKTSKN